MTPHHAFMLVAFASEIALSPAVARAQEAHRHLGFFLRPDLGLGYLSSSESAGSTTVTISGFCGAAGLAIGGAVVEDLILSVHFFDAVVVEPNASITGGP